MQNIVSFVTIGSVLNMMSFTHVLYAKQICEHISLKYGITLKRYSFIYGSVKPDVSILFLGKTKHYFDVSLDMVTESANVLINAINSEKEIETKAFARELGVIMHYITDFFCRVHNDINGIKHSENFRHVLYEQRFQKVLEEYELDVLREKTLLVEDEEIKKIETMSLKNYLIYRHNKYMKEAGKFYFYDSAEKIRQIDMRYSFGISLIVASYIVQKAMK